MSKQVGPALLFENPVNRETGERYAAPVAINLMGSYDRMAWALGVDAETGTWKDLDAVAKRVTDLLPLDMPASMKGKFDILVNLKDLATSGAKEIKKAPCQEVVLRGDEVDLTKLPVLKTWPDDGGPFVTLPLVVTNNLKGKPNVGMYRLQVFDKQHDRAAHPRAPRRREEPAGVARGGRDARPGVGRHRRRSGHDLLGDGARAADDRRVPVRRDHPRRVGRGRQVHHERPPGSRARRDRARGLVRSGGDALGGTVRRPHGLLLARRLLPGLPRRGDHHAPRPDLSRRRSSVRRPWRTTTSARPPSGSSCRSIKAMLPEVIDYDLPLEGVFHNCAIFQIKKEFAGQAFRVMNFAWSMGQMMFTKFVIVVDEDVDCHDYSQVAWRCFNNVDPSRDIQIIEGTARPSRPLEQPAELRLQDGHRRDQAAAGRGPRARVAGFAGDVT